MTSELSFLLPLICLPSASWHSAIMYNIFLLKILIHLTAIVLALLLALGWLGNSAAINSVGDSAVPQARKNVGRLNRPINDNLRPPPLPTLR